MTKTRQVAEAMRRLIVNGHWAIGQSVGDLLSLEEQSETLFGVHASFGTIRAAEQILVDEGILSVVQPGIPTRVIAVPASGDQNPTVANLRLAYARLGEAYKQVGELIASLQ